MRQDIRRQMTFHRERLRTLEITLSQTVQIPMERRRTQWNRASDRLQALSPLAVLERGYALVYVDERTTAKRIGTGPDSLVKDAKQLHADDNVRIRFARGRATARVVETEMENKNKR